MPLSKEKEAQVKREIPSDIETYLANGGKITKCKTGATSTFEETKRRLTSAARGSQISAKLKRKDK